MTMPYLFLLVMFFVLFGSVSTVQATQTSIPSDVQAKISQFEVLLKSGKKRQASDLAYDIARALSTLNTDKSFYYAKQAITLGEEVGDSNLLGKGYFALGVVHYIRGEYEETMATQLKADSLAKMKNDLFVQSRVLNLIGLVYGAWEDDRLALSYYDQAESLAQNDSTFLPNILFNKAISHKNLGEYATAITMLKDLIDGAKRRNTKVEISRFNAMLAECYFKMQEYRLALFHNREALSVVDEKNLWDLGFIYGGFAQTYLALNDLPNALSFGLKGIETQKKLNAKWELQRIYRVVAQTYEAMNKPTEAITYFKLYDAYRDSVYSDRQQLIIARMGLSQKRFENELLMSKQSEQEAQVRLQQYWIITLVVLFGVGSMLLFFLFKANHRSAKLLDVKNQLMAIIGHDMNNMMSGVSGFIDLLASNDISKDELEYVTPILQDNVSRMQLTFTNLLNWTNAQEEDFTPSPKLLSVPASFAVVGSLFSNQALRNEIQLSFSSDPELTFWVDENHVQVVLRNLIHNALKFTPSGGRVDVIATSESHGDEVLIQVRDTGQGMDAETLAHLNSNQTSRRTTKGQRSESGTGLGLQTCKKLLTANNSELLVASELGKGATFSFKLPQKNIALL